MLSLRWVQVLCAWSAVSVPGAERDSGVGDEWFLYVTPKCQPTTAQHLVLKPGNGELFPTAPYLTLSFKKSKNYFSVYSLSLYIYPSIAYFAYLLSLHSAFTVNIDKFLP